MSHTIKNKAALLARVRRIKGQIAAVEHALETERPCGEVLNLVASIRGATTGLTGALMEDHVREHMMSADPAQREDGAAEIIGVLKRYLK